MKIEPNDPRFARFHGMTAADVAAEATRLRTEAGELLTRADAGSLTPEDGDRFESIDADLSYIKHRADKVASMRAAFDAGAVEAGSPFTQPQSATQTRASLAGAQTLTRDQSLVQWGIDNGYTKADQAPLSFDRMVRGLAIGDWTGAKEERALVENTSSAGGVLVPTPIANTVVDLARNKTAVLQAGATVIPLTSQSVRIPRLIGEGSAQFYSEGQQRVASDLSFDSITLRAKAFDRLILISKELFDDSDPSASQVISDSFAAQLALGLDSAALYGSGVDPVPLGLTLTPGVPQISHGTNGTAPTNFDWLVQAQGNIRGFNFEPTASIVSPRTATEFNLAKTTTGEYLSAPASLQPVLATNQVGNAFTVGSATTASQLVTGQFDLLYVGIRQGFTLRVLTERYADTNQIAFLAQMRIDVAVAQPKAFQIDNGIL